MEDVTTYTPFDLKHIRDLLRLIVEVPGMMRLDPSRARVVLDALDARDALLRELVDDDPCRYDHHGYCQTHRLHARPCPHERARKLLGGEGNDGRKT